ncbi:MAG: thioester dehydrase [Colwellia sp.]|uniref:ApeI family dehydratase n=1 Tax=Alteromonadales TaxID=135622 RepID=UPI001D44901F|nr:MULTISPECIES: thioester dehydrase [Alteromonadales]NQZ28153.1 thioester dehydrase [Colwellia sp.]NRA81889.1 thioester dehydrase [Pseudoalteromonas sp.]
MNEQILMKNNAQKLLPSITAIERTSDSVILDLKINAQLRCFKGHFDDVAVVPGVVQLDWAITFAREYLAMSGDVLNISVLKFQKLLLPEMQVQLVIEKKHSEKFSFCYFKDDDKFASARVVLG